MIYLISWQCWLLLSLSKGQRSESSSQLKNKTTEFQHRYILIHANIAAALLYTLAYLKNYSCKT